MFQKNIIELFSSKRLSKYENFDEYLNNPVDFMANVHQYPRHIRIILDTNYAALNCDPYLKTGYKLAEELHALGYTKLILFAGGDMPKGKIPEYLQIVSKLARDGSTENLDKV